MGRSKLIYYNLGSRSSCIRDNIGWHMLRLRYTSLVYRLRTQSEMGGTWFLPLPLSKCIVSFRAHVLRLPKPINFLKLTMKKIHLI